MRSLSTFAEAREGTRPKGAREARDRERKERRRETGRVWSGGFDLSLGARILVEGACAGEKMERNG